MAASQFQQGQLIQADFFDNSRGLNLTDSPLRVLDEQAIGGYNYEYSLTGGFTKRLGHTKMGSSPNAQLRHLGIGQLIDMTNQKTVIRTAGTKFQNLNLTTGALTNLTQDTAAVNSDFIPANQTDPTVNSQFNSAATQVMWVAGANMTDIYGAYSSTKVTKNGSAVPTGAVTGGVTGGSGVWPVTGDYVYSFAYRKRSTQAVSNAGLDVSVTIASVTEHVHLVFTGLTNIDVTLYDAILIYRSPVSGLANFTTGDLVTILPIATTTYDDTGAFTAPAVNVPRPGNIILDNGVLPAGIKNVLTTYKRRLVTAVGSTIYLSDLNKPESWPLTNVITVPSGGPITGLAVISFNTPTSTGADEFLVIFKESELWIITGSSFEDWSLKYIDRTGCINQPLIVSANGYLFWIDYRGVYIWDGSGKPMYASRPIEYQFSVNGTLDKSKLHLGVGTFHKKTNQVVWLLSDAVLGEQQYSLKMDLRLTLPAVQDSLMGRIVDAVFVQDRTSFPLYGGYAVLPAGEETFIAGDASGFTYRLFDGVADSGGGINFSYRTKIFDLGKPTQTKRYHKLIVWVEDSTDAMLTINFWVNYRIDSVNQSSMSLPVSAQVTRAIWDEAYWDATDWDSNFKTFSPLVFNLNSEIGVEGDGFCVEFVQSQANAPVSIAGFSVIYSLAGLRK